jgi:hypothetical protein
MNFPPTTFRTGEEKKAPSTHRRNTRMQPRRLIPTSESEVHVLELVELELVTVERSGFFTELVDESGL